MDQSKTYSDSAGNYIQCPRCGFWYDIDKGHICLNKSKEDSEQIELLKEILKVLKNIEYSTRR